MAKEITIMLGGEAGQGVQSMGQVLSRSLARLGLHVFALQDFESRIRGGHAFFQLRAAESWVGAHLNTVDILIALTEETIHLHENQLGAESMIIYDSDNIKGDFSGSRYLPLKLVSVSREETSSSAMANTVALGAVWSMMGLKLEVLEGVLASFFGAKSADIVEKNVKAARRGYELGTGSRREAFAVEVPGGPARMVLSGTEAVSLGAIAADCRFYSAYPMTPATGVMEFLAHHGKKYGIVVEQAEDEISALNMAVGASFMGVRSMVGTSGGGFCLMTEALGLAGCIETPVVVLNAMRPGPSTGMPTRTGQADLLFVIFAAQDEFPRVVLAPTGPESAFKLTVEAFNLADRLQTPVIILSDHHLATSYWTVDDLYESEVTVDRGVLATEEELASGDKYLRYRLTESGVSPRAWPGQGSALVVSSGDEHDESGHITEEPNIRTAMVDKRLRKLDLVKSEPGLEADIQLGADTVLVGWGSTAGVLREVVDTLRDEGQEISFIQVYRMWPFPVREFLDRVKGHEKIIVVENNSLGQMARLMSMETGVEATETLHKYDGRPFSVDEILSFFTKRRK